MCIFYRKFIFSALLIALLPSLAEAKICCYQKEKPIVLSMSLPERLSTWYMDIGMSWVFNQRLGKKQLDNEDLPPDTYLSPKAQQIPGFSLSGGYIWSHQANWLPFTSLGLEYNYFGPTRVEGVIEDYSFSDEANQLYKYRMTQNSLYLVGKADLMRWGNVMPYASIGVGTAWNRFSDYSEQVISDLPSEHINPEFPSKTKLSFSYSLGTGIDYSFNKNIWASLGYRYTHFGNFKSGESMLHNPSSSEHLSGVSAAHLVVFSLRYLF